ncbi:MFS transporter [Sphaerisporangium corydalis]|uniref:MFS transporter n=1 Tax=Sphaerisporangium corydalis TaxID=1441875 RepID=A0ABV9ESM1_9ACTN|nr:MFS transporter [Sphaerisporangium corydalis]
MKRGIDRLTLLGLLGGTLGVSTSFGMLLLLPLFLKERLHGDEADFGLISAAGTVTAAIAIGILIRYPRRFPPHYLLGFASAAYALAALGVSFANSMSWPLIVLGMVLGTTWAVAYTTAPMVVSDLSDDVSRSKYIGYATGMVQVGFGLGPVVGDLLLRMGMDFAGIFRVAALISIVSAFMVLPLHLRSPELRPARVRVAEPPLIPALLAIARSRAVGPLVIVLLCACLFTTMNSFQTTYAAEERLSFNVFYIAYTLSVIITRFVLVRAFRDPSSPLVLAGASAGLVAAVLLFLVVGGNPLLYGVASVALGVTYGLTLPAVQAGAVNASAEEYRPRMLPLVGLMFEVAILAFPLAAGAIISSSGYTVLFLVLLGFAVAIAALGGREALVARAPAPAADAGSALPQTTS